MASKLLTFAVVILALMAGVYLLDQAKIISISPPEAPIAGGLWSVSFLLSSSVDRTVVSELISDSGHLLVYTASDNSWDGAGDLNVDLSIVNLNVGDPGANWAFEAILLSESQLGTGGPLTPIINRTSTGQFDERRAITWSLTTVASSGAQVGERFISNSWKTGVSNVLNFDAELSPTGMAFVESETPAEISIQVGGIILTVRFLESV